MTSVVRALTNRHMHKNDVIPSTADDVGRRINAQAFFNLGLNSKQLDLDLDSDSDSKQLDSDSRKY